MLYMLLCIIYIIHIVYALKRKKKVLMLIRGNV